VKAEVEAKLLRDRKALTTQMRSRLWIKREKD